jgi:peroxiredoxin
VAPLLDATCTLADGSTASLKSMLGTTATVFITLDPECPFCQLYAHDFQEFAAHYAEQGVRLVGIYAGPYMEADKAAQFAKDGNFTFPQVMDHDCTLTLALQARVTPEVFLMDAEGALVYNGAFDDRAVRQGRKKYDAQKHYLADAMKAFLRDGAHSPEVTAVGCIVECKK